MRRPDTDLEEKREPRGASSAGAREDDSMYSSGRSLTLAAIEKGPSSKRAATTGLRRLWPFARRRPAVSSRPIADLRRRWQHAGPCPFSDLVRRLTKPSDRMESGHPYAG